MTQEEEIPQHWDNEAQGAIEACLNGIEKAQKDYWLGEWVKERVACPEEVFDAALETTDAIVKMSLKLVSEGSPDEFIRAQHMVQEFAEHNFTYAKRRRILTSLTAEELIPIAGNQKAIEALVDSKMVGAQMGAGQDSSADSNEWEFIPPELAELQGYERDLRVMSMLTPDELQCAAGSRDKLEGFIVEAETEARSDFSELDGLPPKRCWTIDAAARLVTPPLMSSLPEAEMRLRLVWENIWIKLLDFLTREKASKACARLWALSQLVVRADPSPKTRRFLSLVSRCYIYGLDGPCLIVCRGVLDTAFDKEAVPDDVCEKHRGKREDREHKYGLADRIISANCEGIISREIKHRALDVKDRGDDAVHAAQFAKRDVLDTIQDTLAVLQALDKNRR